MHPGEAEGDQLGKAVQFEFNARPVWAQASLAHQMPSAAEPDLAPHLQRLCYQFKDGMTLCTAFAFAHAEALLPVQRSVVSCAEMLCS